MSAPERLLGLAAGNIPELSPPEFVSACADAGWSAAGISFQADQWSEQTARETRARLDDTGLIALDMEAVVVGPVGDAGDMLVDAAAEVGARNVLVMGMGIEPEAFAVRFADLCDRAAPAAINAVVEFMVFSSIRTLSEALEVVKMTDRSNAGILVDNIHLQRSGGSPDDLAQVDPALLPYVQLCDAPADPGDDLMEDALDRRCLLGDGDLPVDDYLDVLPDTAPISAEFLSRSLRESYPDPVERAQVALQSVSGALTRH